MQQQFSSFEQAKKWARSLKSNPYDGEGKQIFAGEKHETKTETHNMISFSHHLFKSPKLEVIIEWNSCPDCGDKIRNSKIVVLSGREVFRKYFIRHGENVALEALFNS